MGIGYGRTVQVWKDLLLKGSEGRADPYLTHQVPGDVSVLQFSPFEDCLGIGHAVGFSSILVPGVSGCGFVMESPSQYLQLPNISCHDHCHDR